MFGENDYFSVRIIVKVSTTDDVGNGETAKILVVSYVENSYEVAPLTRKDSSKNADQPDSVNIDDENYWMQFLQGTMSAAPTDAPLTGSSQTNTPASPCDGVVCQPAGRSLRCGGRFV